jgi:hypothetical protein
MLSVFALGSSGFKSSSEALSEETETSCFEAARSFVIAVWGEINLDTVQIVLDINEACEDGRLETR